MKHIKAIVYGVGTMGGMSARYLYYKGIDIVAAIDLNPNLVGKDLGEVAGLDHALNIRISDDADKTLSETKADVAIVSIYSRTSEMFPIIKQCVVNRLNVISPAEELLYPWQVAPELAAELDNMAKLYGVTIIGSGQQDSLRVNIVSLLTGSSHCIESITIKQTNDLSKAGPVSASNYCLGEKSEDLYQKTEDFQFNSLEMCLEAVISDLGLAVTETKHSVVPILAEGDLTLPCLTNGVVKQGSISGMTKIIDIKTRQKINFRGEQVMKIFTDEEKQKGNSATECVVKGIPCLYLKIEINDIEAKSSMVSPIINRIPDVLNCKPGLVTVESLPKLKFRYYPLETYLGHKL